MTEVISNLKKQYPELCAIANQLWAMGYKTPSTQLDKHGLTQGKFSTIVRHLKQVDKFVTRCGFFQGQRPIVHGQHIYDGKHRLAHALAHGINIPCVVISSSPRLNINDIDTAASRAQELLDLHPHSTILIEPVPISDLEMLLRKSSRSLESGNVAAQEDAAASGGRIL